MFQLILNNKYHLNEFINFIYIAKFIYINYLKMSLFGNLGNPGNSFLNSSAAPTTTPQKNIFGGNSGGLFGNTQQQPGGLFGNNNNNSFGGNSLFTNINQQNNSIFGNNNTTNTSFFSTNNNNNNLFTNSSNNQTNNTSNIFPNNNINLKDSTIGFKFEGNNVPEKNVNSTFMNITSKDEYIHASTEELRLADLEQKRTGAINKFKIINTSSNKILAGNNNNHNSSTSSNPFSFGNNSSNKGLFGGGTILGNNNTSTTTGIFGTSSTTSGGIFGSNNNTNTGGIFGSNNNTQGGGLFGNNNNQGGSLFLNNNQGSSLFGNNNTQSSGLFGNQNSGNSIFGNNKSGGLFGNNTNQTNSLFGNNNTQSGGLFGNSNTQGSSIFGNNNTQGSSIFGNNNTQSGGLFGNNNNTQSGGLFGNNNNTQSGGLFGNNNNNTQSGGLFGNNNNTQSGGLFGNNNNTQSGGLFGNNNNNTQSGGIFGNNNNNTQSGGLFGNNNNNNTQSGGLFGNNNNNTQSGGLFGNNSQSSSLFNKNTSIFGNNNQQSGGLFGNNTNNTNSLFGNTTNNTPNNNSSSLFGNNNQGNSLFGNNSSSGGLFGNNTSSTNTGGLFGNNQNNEPNKTSGNSLFGNNTSSLFNNNTSSNTGSLFGNNNTTNNTSTGLFNQNKSLFGGNTTTGGDSLFGNTTTNQTNSLFGNNNQQNNANINNAITPGLYSDITYEDIVNPLNYLETKKSLKLSPQDEILSKSIAEAVEKQKSAKEFMEDLDKKYEKINNLEEKNADILENYGTYLNSPSNNYDTEKTYLNRRLNIKINNDDLSNSTQMKYRYWNNRKNDEISSYSQEVLNNSISKINEIYDEYERYKNSFDMVNNSKINSSLQASQFKFKKSAGGSKIFKTNYSKIENGSMIRPNLENSNSMMGRDENLYQKNLMEFNKFSSYDIGKDNDNEILVINYQNENDNNNNVDLVIKYKLPGEDNEANNNTSKLHLNNVTKLISIKTLREEIKERIYNELKLNGLEKIYTIERLSLLIGGVFLDDNKKLNDYIHDDFDFNIKAFITYTNIAQKKKEIKENNKSKKVYKEVKIKRENNLREDQLVPIDLVPILTKEGYKCSPSIMELSRKTTHELRNVENFRIFNKFGEVEFQEPVNLLGLNLDNQVIIERNLIDTGDKLDYKSVFRLYNFKVEENGLNKYKFKLQNSGGNFLSYKNNELVWEYDGKKKGKN